MPSRRLGRPLSRFSLTVRETSRSRVSYCEPMDVVAVWLAESGYSAGALWPLMVLIGLAVGVPFGLAEFAFHRAALRRALRFVRPPIAMAPVPSQ